MNFGDNLKKLRKQNGLSVDKLSKRSGVSPSQIFKLESGKREITNEVAHKIVKGLGIQTEVFEKETGYTLKTSFEDKMKEMVDRDILKGKTREELIERSPDFIDLEDVRDNLLHEVELYIGGKKLDDYERRTVGVIMHLFLNILQNNNMSKNEMDEKLEFILTEIGDD